MPNPRGDMTGAFERAGKGPGESPPLPDTPAPAAESPSLATSSAAKEHQQLKVSEEAPKVSVTETALVPQEALKDACLHWVSYGPRSKLTFKNLIRLLRSAYIVDLMYPLSTFSLRAWQLSIENMPAV